MIVRPHGSTEKIEARSFFLSDTWLEAQDQGLEVMEVCTEDGNRVRAQFSVFSYSKLGVPLIITPPMAPHCALQFGQISDNPAKRQTSTKRILRSMAAHFAERKAYVDLAFPTFIKDVQPFKEHGYEVDVAYTYLLDLEKSPEELLASMSPERRKNIRDAGRMDFEVVMNVHQGEAQKLIADTLKSRGVKPRESVLEKLLKANNEDVFSLVVSAKGKILAAALIGMDESRSYYLAGGTTKDQNQAGPLVLYHAMLESKNRGVKKFDFLGSSVPAIERYFRGFGGELTPYFRVRKNTGLIDFLKSTKERFGS
jgi:hypothetical protein